VPKILGNVGWGLVVATTILATTSVQSATGKNGDGPAITVDDGKRLDDVVRQKEKKRKQRRQKRDSSTKNKKVKSQVCPVCEQGSSVESSKPETSRMKSSKAISHKAKSQKHMLSQTSGKCERSPIDLKKNKACKATTVAGAGFVIKYDKKPCAVVFDRASLDRNTKVIRFTKTEKAESARAQTKKQKGQGGGLRERISRWRKSNQNFVAVGGKKYFFHDVDFHFPSAHSLDGKKPYPLELHLLYISQDGEIVVIGAFVTEGKFNKFLQPMISKLNGLSGKDNVLVKGFKLYPRAFLPQFRDAKNVYSYNGTTIANPPFVTKNVKWMIYQTPIEMSSEQIAEIQKRAVYSVEIIDYNETVLSRRYKSSIFEVIPSRR